MKLITTILLALSIATAVSAAAPERAVSDKVKKQVLAQLMASPAVRGAYAETKNWSGAVKCSALVIEELTESSFKAYASCNNPGNPSEDIIGASGQFQVHGQVLSGSEPDSEVTISINGITFSHAG